jgi:hypothetical protein
MAYKLHPRSGQAMAELIVAMLAITLIVLALTEFVPVFVDNINLQREVREEAGMAALKSDVGVSSADRSSEFELDIPGEWIDSAGTSGAFAEKMYMPAANLACNEQVHIPNIAGVTEEIRYANRGGTSAFLSATASGSMEQVLARARTAFVGAGWTVSAIGTRDTVFFVQEDLKTAAAHVKEETFVEGEAVIRQIRLTVIARSAGSSIGY